MRRPTQPTKSPSMLNRILKWTGLVVGLVLVVLVGKVAMQLGLQYSLVRSFTVPPCSAKTQFTTTPMDVSALDDITPLGNISPVDHTIPTDHMYLNASQDDYPLVAPGNVWVTEVEYSSNASPGHPAQPDYEVRFTSCKGTDFYFGHVSELAGVLTPAASNHGDCKIENHAAGETQTYCRRPMNTAVKAGQLIGQMKPVETGKWGLDFGLYKGGYKDPGLADAKFYYEVNAACPLDFFDASSQVAMYTKVSRTAAPRCGQVGQDKVGTVQGAWYAEADAQKARADWNIQMAVVHDNHHPEIGVIALGGGAAPNSGQGFKMGYHPQTSGTVNVEPSATKAGVLYCYQSDQAVGQAVPFNDRGGDRLLLELDSTTQMRVEYQQGTCDASVSFAKPTAYYR